MRTLLAVLIVALTIPGAGALGYLEQIEVKIFAAMREVERHQLGIAEKHYQKGEFKIAADEYDKFLGLYEKSPGAPYAQLMWSHCQAKLRLVNSAIRDGFQSVIDYWPDSHEAVLASYLIGRSYDDIGQVEKAEKAYLKTANDHADHYIGTLAKLDLLHLAKVRKDEKRQMLLLADLTFDTERSEANANHLANASRELAGRHLRGGAPGEAIRALETTYRGRDLVKVYNDIAGGVIDHFMRDEKTVPQAVTLADSVIGMVEKLIPEGLQSAEERKAAREAWLRIANLHARTGRHSEVLATYKKMIAVLGEDDSLLGLLAGFHRGRKQFDAARAAYARYSDKVAGKLAIAETYIEEERPDEAIAIYAALEDQVQGQGLMAALYRQLTRYDDAIACYGTLLKIDAGNANVHRWAIGECHEAATRLRKAIASYGLVDDFPRTYFKMASLHRQLKEYPRALSLYGQCKVHGPSAPEAFLSMAYTYEEAGKRENAIRAFQTTCKNFPKSGHASRAHAHLQDKYGISITLGGAKEE